MLVYLPIQNIKLFLLSLVLRHLPDVASFWVFFFFGLLVCFPTLVNVLHKNSYHLLEHFHSKKTPLHPISSSLNISFASGLSRAWLSQKDRTCLDAFHNGCPLPPISHTSELTGRSVVCRSSRMLSHNFSSFFTENML